MKLLFAIKSMNTTRGGAERVLAVVTAGLAARGHETCLLTFDRPGGASVYPLAPGIVRLDLGIGDSGRRAGFMETLARMRALRHTVTERRPDAVIAFMHSMFIPAAFALAGTGIPVIASEHIVPRHYRSRKAEFIMLCAAGLLARRVTVLSEAIRRSYPAFLRGRMTVMPNPVTPASLAARPDADGVKTILTVGRLDPQKDQETLIAAFARLASRYPQWRLRIIGQGLLREILQAQIDDSKLESVARIEEEAADIEGAYRAAHIFAMPSLYESFGLATAEAMAHGLPVIGFADCPGTNELVRAEREGLLVAGSDRVQALAEGLARLMDDPARRVTLGQAGQERVKDFSPEVVVSRWEELLHAAISAPR